MKPLIIYHNHCTDGFGAAFAAWMKFGDEAEYMPAAYGDKNKFWKNEDGTFDSELTILNREIYILDFSFDRWIMEGLLDLTKRVVWLDHHKTAFEMWCGEYEKGMRREIDLINVSNQRSEEAHYILLDDNKSGALIAWEYFHPNTEVPMLIQHIDDRDRWVFAIEGSKELHAALQSLQPWSFEQWKALLRDTHTAFGGSSANLTALYNIGNALLRAQDITVERQAKQAIVCGIPYSEVPTPKPVAIGLAVNTQNHISETGHVLANKSGTYGLLWYVGADGKVKCSLRSNGDYDVSAIAKAFGGGGHKNASGMEVTLEQLQSWLV